MTEDDAHDAPVLAHPGFEAVQRLVALDGLPLRLAHLALPGVVDGSHPFDLIPSGLQVLPRDHEDGHLLQQRLVGKESVVEAPSLAKPVIQRPPPLASQLEILLRIRIRLENDASKAQVLHVGVVSRVANFLQIDEPVTTFVRSGRVLRLS